MRRRLPPTWLETTIDELFRTTGGGTPATGRSEFWGDGVPWITSADIDDGGDITPRKAVTRSGIAHSATNPVPPGSVVVVTRVGLGKVGLAKQELCFSQDCQALLFNPQLLDPSFVAHQMRRTVRGIRGRGTTIAGVTVNQLGALPFRLTALSEQHRIVEAIESYLTRLDDAVTSLERVQAKLKAYRASVLKAAVEGRLVPTEAALARAEKRAYEPAQVLLGLILKERRRRWEEAEVAKLKAGEAPKDHKWKTKYKEPVAADMSALPELPEGWSWSCLDQLLAEPLTNGKSVPDGNGVPVLRLTCIKNGLVDLTERKSGDWNDIDPQRFLVEADDFFIIRGNGSIHLVGRGGHVSAAPDGVAYPDTLIRARVDPAALYPPLLARWWDSPPVRRHIERRAKTTAGIYKVNQADLGQTPVPLAPMLEQTRIFDELERVDTTAIAATATIEAAVRRCSRLRQAVLKWAFEGKLADQDPTDEPAERLLARIRAERASVGPTKQSQGRKTKGAA